MGEACGKLVPGISGMIKDYKDYFRFFEVMAEILSPGLLDEEWDSSKWITAGEPSPEMTEKIHAAAGDARIKVEGDHGLADLIKEKLLEYRDLAESEEEYVQKLKSYLGSYEAKKQAKAKRRKKTSHTDSGAEGRKGEDGDVTEEK